MILNYVLKYITKLFDIPFVLCNMWVKNSINWFPLNTVYTVSNCILMCCFWDRMLKNNFHNGSNTWPDFHNNNIYFISKLIYNLFPYSIVMSPKMHNKHAFSPGARFNKEVQPTMSLNLNSELSYSEMGKLWVFGYRTAELC